MRNVVTFIGPLLLVLLVAGVFIRSFDLSSERAAKILAAAAIIVSNALFALIASPIGNRGYGAGSDVIGLWTFAFLPISFITAAVIYAFVRKRAERM